MKVLLRLKAWQLFLLLIIPVPIIDTVGTLHLPITTIWLIFYIGWIYSIGAAMHSFIPQQQRPNIIYFKICCIAILFSPIVLALVNQVFLSLWFVVLISFFFSLFYVFAFAARMLESVIEGEIVNVSDSLKALVCFWVFPFGVWHIQPAVHRVLESRKKG